MLLPESVQVPVPVLVTFVTFPVLLSAMMPLRRAVPAVEPWSVRVFAPLPVLVMFPVRTSWPEAPDWSILTSPVPPLRLMFLSEVSPVPVYLSTLTAVLVALEDPMKIVPFRPRALLLPVIPKEAVFSVVVVLLVLALMVTGPVNELLALPRVKFPFPEPAKLRESAEPPDSASKPLKFRVNKLVLPLERNLSSLFPVPDIAKSLDIVMVALPAVIVPPPVVPARSMTLSVVSLGDPLVSRRPPVFVPFPSLIVPLVPRKLAAPLLPMLSA